MLAPMFSPGYAMPTSADLAASQSARAAWTCHYLLSEGISMPSRHQRKIDPRARNAWIAWATRISAAMGQRYPELGCRLCVTCGKATGSWCDDCELLGIGTFERDSDLPRLPGILTPYCVECENENTVCAACGNAPNNAPNL